MKNINSILPFVIIISLLACQSDYDFHLDREQKYVINCLFHPDSIWQVELIKTPGSFWGYDFNTIDEAVVRVKSDQLINLNQFESDGMGFYTSNEHRVPAASDQLIELYASHDGNELTAKSHIPADPEFEWTITRLEGRKYEHRTLSDYFHYRIKGQMQMTIVRDDDPYYSISISYRIGFLHSSPGGGTLEYLNTTVFDRLSVSIEHPGAFTPIRQTDGIFIDLSESDTKQNIIHITIDGGIDNLQVEPGFFVISVFHHTKEFFEYNRKVLQQFATSQDLFSEPVNITSNITGGLGIFSGVNSRTDTVWMADY